MENKIRENDPDKIAAILRDQKQITETLQKAVRQAVKTHKLAGNPIAVWKDGKTVWIKAENL